MFKKTSFVSNNEKGFTLLELLLYISTASIILATTSLFLSTLLEARIKNQTVAEVQQQGLQVIQILTQSIRNAESISAPSLGQNSQSLTITESGEEIIFNVSDGVIQMQEGVQSIVPLTNSRVIASGVSFSNLGLQNTNGSIKISFTLTHKNDTGRNEYTFTKDFLGSASLR